MPVSRPAARHYATATKACNHGDLVVEDGFVGEASKQRNVAWTTPITDQAKIAIGETFVIITKGLVSVADGGLTWAKGTPVYIKTSDNTIQQAAGAGIVKAGRVESITPERGTRTGRIRVDLDAKDSF